MLTRMFVVPDGEELLADRIKHEVRKDFTAHQFEIKTWRQVKEPHLPTKSGTPYWVTLWEPRKKSAE